MSSLYSLQHDWLRLLSKSQLIVAEGLHPDSPSEAGVIHRVFQRFALHFPT